MFQILILFFLIILLYWDKYVIKIMPHATAFQWICCISQVKLKITTLKC